MIVTFSELRVTVQKALIGAGAPTGIREEGSEVALWLEARAIPAIERVLQAIEQSFDLRTSTFLRSAVRASNKATFECAGQSALYLGPALFDFLAREGCRTERSVSFEMKRLAHGAFLLPLLEEYGGRSGRISLTTRDHARIAVADERGISLGGDWTRHTGAKDYCLETGPDNDLSTTETTSKTLQQQYCSHLRDGITVDDDLWRRLCDYALRSYVPDSEESRLRGAGAQGEPAR